MPELTTPIMLGALVLFVAIVGTIVMVIPRVMGRQCPSCLRRVPRGQRICPACGSVVLR